MMVGLILDGRECGFAAHAFAEDLARFLARHDQPTHLFLLVPTPVQAPRLLHMVRRADRPAARVESGALGHHVSLRLDEEATAIAADALAEQLARQIGLHRLTALHALGLDLAGRVAHAAHLRTGIPYFVTPRNGDLSRSDSRFRESAAAVVHKAHRVIAFDSIAPKLLQAHLRTEPQRQSVIPRAVDLDTFRPLPRTKRPQRADMLLGRRDLQPRLEGIDWLRGFIVLAVESRRDRHGFERFLFAIPEMLRQQPALQVIVVGAGDPVTDGLRAALAAGRAELLHDVVSTSELCQPLVDHLEWLHREHRAEAWWQAAARLEPERRVRFAGPVSRAEFVALLRSADLLVLPGDVPRPPSQMLFEAMACGVLPIASETAGIACVAESVAENISMEIASLCVLRSEPSTVREIEDTVGRVARLRPDLTVPLRALAEARHDGERMAVALRQAYTLGPSLSAWPG
jgi:glycosyltransferase involved in cell wall biosynthesis